MIHETTSYVLGQFKLFDYMFCCKMKQLHVVFIWFLAQQTTETPFIPLQIRLWKRPSIGTEGRKMHGEIALLSENRPTQPRMTKKSLSEKSPRRVPNKDALAQGFGASVWPEKAPTKSRTQLLDRFRKNSPRHWPIQREAHRASCPQIHQGQTCWWVQWLILGLPLHFCAKNWKSSSLVPFRKSSLFFFRIFSKATWIPTRTQQFLKECWGGRGWLPFSNTGFVHSYFVMYRFSSSSAYKVHWTRLVVRPGHLPRSFPCFQPDELPQRLRCKIAWQRHEAPWHVHWISHWGVWWSVQLVSKRS